jgi:hypothetical protein
VILKEQEDGVGTVIEALLKLERSLRARARASARQKKLVRGERKYFENQRERMDYATYIAKGLPIGSGEEFGWLCPQVVRHQYRHLCD